MNILVNAISARRGGGQTYIKELLQNLEDTGARVYLLAPASLSLNGAPANVTRIRVWWPTYNPFLRIIWETLRLPGLIKRIKADVAFFPGGLINCNVPAGCRVVTTFQNMLPFSRDQRAEFSPGYMRMRHWLLERGLLAGMRRSDLVIFLCDFARDLITRRLGHDLKSSQVIPHGIGREFKKTKALPRPAWLPEEYILYVSDFYEYKNQLEVVRAYARLKRKRKTVEKLLLVGYAGTDYGKKVKIEILRLGVEDDIMMAGLRRYEELPVVNHYAKIVVFASECENCPIILLEAMGEGKPLIVADRRPMPEFGGDAVVYFDPTSPEELADRILEIIDRPDRLRELGDRARAQSLQYDWRMAARRTWEAITGIGKSGS